MIDTEFGRLLNIDALKSSLLIFTLLLPRMLAAFTVIPFMGKQVMGGAMLRNGVVMSLALFVYPVAEQGMADIEMDALTIGLVLIKEIFIGLLIGFLAAIPFWGIEAVGFYIDNQRGATMASSLNPLSGSQTSPLGILLAQAVTTAFFAAGTFLLFLGGLYQSYRAWPVVSFIPTIDPSAMLFFIGQMDVIMNMAVLYSAPAIIAMFLSEFGLGMVNRFAPQLNVFFLSMPIKSAVAMIILIIYMSTLLGFFSDYLRDAAGVFVSLQYWIG